MNWKYLPVLIVALLVGGHIYWFFQVQRLDDALFDANSEISNLSERLRDRSSELNAEIGANASRIDGLDDLGATRAESFSMRLDAIEADLHEEVVGQISQRIVNAATADAIQEVILNDLPQSGVFVQDLGLVLVQKFGDELRGEPGVRVDPALLVSILARDEDFLDAIRLELLTEIAPIE